MKQKYFNEFIAELEQKLNGRPYKVKAWRNFPQSIFYYYDDDNECSSEIAIYTSENAYGIYI